MAANRGWVRTVWSTLLFLVLIVLVSAGVRVYLDGPNVAAGVVPEDPFDRRYALHPVLAYAHILPGVVYLVGVPFQLSRGFRERHFTLHRRMGRVLIPAGITAGIFAIIFGTWYPFDGLLQASATVIFGFYFIAALSIAFFAIRRGDATRHRRWMIRAFAIGLAVGTIRVWIGLFETLGGLGLLSFQISLGAAFWLSFPLHALVAEAYLAWRPSYEGTRTPVHS